MFSIISSVFLVINNERKLVQYSHTLGTRIDSQRSPDTDDPNRNTDKIRTTAGTIQQSKVEIMIHANETEMSSIEDIGHRIKRKIS